MTTANTNNIEVLFQDISVEDTASISGGESIITSANASAYFLNNTGGIAQTQTFTSAIDQGTHEGISSSRSVAIAFNDTNTAPGVLGPAGAGDAGQFLLR